MQLQVNFKYYVSGYKKRICIHKNIYYVTSSELFEI